MNERFLAKTNYLGKYSDKCWNIGIMKYFNIGMLKYWNVFLTNN